MIITIGGLAGTGTSTAAKHLSEYLNIPYISAGDVFRQLAKEHNMSVLEFNEFAEGNDEIDIELDKRQAKIANEADNLIVEGRISAFFVNADYRIWLMAPDNIRAERISYREDKSLDTVIKEIKERTASEKKRYQEIHDINIDNLGIYDIVINTGTFDEQATLNIITKCIE
ncbi:AAA family ATPase [Methanosphaera sp. ISO3-F5]|uniref:(d)CMP kinase n=1 Tax=Methanosphaera sp. ISO3-F5 TaxID=1452353 RepID=UPI002B25C162|nr:AAA family ATPase [Methanosphaera sp. ISO3-F5]WQH64002.1 AAA family ATPase [Methanosphaera sp. ISO3-F5]